MFLCCKPPESDLRQFVSSLSQSNFSYSHVGATAASIPLGYVVDHNRVQIGLGANAWKRGMDAVTSWEMFNTGWTDLCWPDAPIRVGTNVAVLIRHYGFYSLNGARIVYLIDEDGPVKRFGFAYGTLLEHAESGEERFLVEWNQREDSVWYDLLAFSKPAQLLSRMGFPLARALQRRFAEDSKARMVTVVW
jgi:uncharacterized protein (UPF0548 family)